MAAPILIVNSSPRPKGNSAHLAAVCGEVFTQQGVPWQQVDLRRLRIAPCKACNHCGPGQSPRCSQPDDMEPLYEQVAQCRALLLISPVYWFNYSAQLKTFIDRLYALWRQEPKFLAGKPTGAALVYAEANLEESGGVHAAASFQHMFNYIQADFRGLAYGTAGAVGDAAGNAELLQRTRELALVLAQA